MLRLRAGVFGTALLRPLVVGEQDASRSRFLGCVCSRGGRGFCGAGDGARQAPHAPLRADGPIVARLRGTSKAMRES
jgi:hypothetical protein